MFPKLTQVWMQVHQKENDSPNSATTSDATEEDEEVNEDGWVPIIKQHTLQAQVHPSAL